MKYPCLVRKNVCKTPIHVTLYGEGLTEDGSPEIVFEAELLCNWQGSAKTVFTTEQKRVELSSAALFPGDICAELAAISGGSVELYGVKRTIACGKKARNPDGTVNYTELDVV